MVVFNVFYQFQVTGLFFFFKFQKIKFGGIVKQEIKLVSPHEKKKPGIFLGCEKRTKARPI